MKSTQISPTPFLLSRIQGLRSSGLLSRWVDKWLPHTTSSVTTPSPVIISLLHVQGVLLVLPVGVGLALGVLTLERIYVRWMRKQLCQTVVTVWRNVKVFRVDVTPLQFCPFEDGLAGQLYIFSSIYYGSYWFSLKMTVCCWVPLL